MSKKKLTLNDAQKAMYAEWRDKYIAIQLDTSPMDREAIRRSVIGLYAAAKLDPPGAVVFVDSPVVAAIAGCFAAMIWWERDRFGAELPADMVRSAIRQASRAAWDSISGVPVSRPLPEVNDATYAATRAATYDATRAATDDATRAATYDATRAATYDATYDATRAATRVIGDSDGLAIRMLSACQYWYRMANQGNHWAYSIASLTFLRDVGGLVLREHEVFRHYEAMAIGSGMRMVHARFAIVSEKPEILKTVVVDGRHVSHCDDGPSHRWRDGFSLWHLNGVKVPEWLAETDAERLDPRRIFEIENAEVRREFVRKVGVDRVCYSLGAECIDRDGNYELLLLDLKDGRKRPYLKMLNPSIDTWHVEGVHPDCRSVQEALNFRNGITPEMIDDIDGSDWFQQGDVVLKPRGARKLKSRPVVLT